MAAGCAANSAEPVEPVDGFEPLASTESTASLDRSIERDVRASRRTRTLAAPERWEVRSLPEPPPQPAAPLGIRQRVNVRFRGAGLADALRLLADAGGFAFVAEGNLTGTVDVELERVRPYDALVAIAETHGAEVREQGRIVIVTARRSSAP